jgi:hypothetical protein
LEKYLLKLAALWVSTAVVHLWLVFEAQLNPQTAPFNDVNLYGYWVSQVNSGQGLLGVSEPWVYPFLAFAPMTVANWIGTANGVLTGWVVLVGLLHVIALSAVVDWGRAGKNAFRAVGFYLLYLVLLGPVAIGRIDAIAAFFALLGVVQVQNNRAKLAMILFTAGAWIKIWPAAAAIALFASAKSKLKYLVAALATSAAILVFGVLLGGNEKLLSFVTMQGDRGLQVESVLATFWIWAAKLGAAGTGIYFDNQLVTNQVSGVWVSEVAWLLGPVMVFALAITVFLGLRAYRAGADSKHLFVATFLTATLDLIVFNKVGSPQFELWIAVPLMAGVLFNLPNWKLPVSLGLAIALLTNLLYPIFYMDLMVLGWLGIAILTVRNALLVALLVWANLRLSKLAN